MSKASVLKLRVPVEFKHRIVQVAEEQGVSVNQLAMYMFTRGLGDLEGGQHIANIGKDIVKKK